MVLEFNSLVFGVPLYLLVKDGTIERSTIALLCLTFSDWMVGYSVGCRQFDIVHRAGSELLTGWLQNLPSMLADASVLVLGVLIERLAAAMDQQVARLWLFALLHDNLTILKTLDLAEARECDQRVRTEFLEKWRSVKEHQLIHKFDSYFCENCTDEGSFGKAKAVHIVSGGFQVLPVPGQTLESVVVLLLDTGVSEHAAGGVGRGNYGHFGLVFE